MTDPAYIQTAEQRRRRRERELLLLLLFGVSPAIKDAITVWRHGGDWQRTIDNVVMGNEGSGDRGVVDGVASYFANAHRGGMLLANEYLDKGETPPDTEFFVPMYVGSAREMVVAISGAMKRAFSDGLDPKTDTTRQQVRRIRDSLDAAGYTRANPFALESGIERGIVRAFNGGILSASSNIDIGREEVGFRHVSVIDTSTTKWCRPRDGIQLPRSHPYWLLNVPPLHWGCRSLLMPLRPPYVVIEPMPGLPLPTPGFGTFPLPLAA